MDQPNLEAAERAAALRSYRNHRRLESLLIVAQSIAESEDVELEQLLREALRRTVGNLDSAAMRFEELGGSKSLL